MFIIQRKSEVDNDFLWNVFNFNFWKVCGWFNYLLYLHQKHQPWFARTIYVDPHPRMAGNQPEEYTEWHLFWNIYHQNQVKVTRTAKTGFSFHNEQIVWNIAKVCLLCA